jgi:hypothetical protein
MVGAHQAQDAVAAHAVAGNVAESAKDLAMALTAEG